ncbi:hypothetical protein FNV43_RR22524 [Rhamnella rubrinervis]|uniref:Uncharacterized protein n=1 Tax=Rhamnella rubrinervis TaxID=2594499 RepID=A0A8K0DXA1_9ROSA|nr:hypothetical protein FNV43_RR22524 [Rhamnella rubrinervis]
MALATAIRSYLTLSMVYAVHSLLPIMLWGSGPSSHVECGICSSFLDVLYSTVVALVSCLPSIVDRCFFASTYFEFHACLLSFLWRGHQPSLTELGWQVGGSKL